MNNIKIEPKREPPEENEIEGHEPGISIPRNEEIAVKTEVHFQNSTQIDEPFSDVPSVGVELSDILGLSEKELAMQIYQAETGIKYLYFVLIRKTEQLRYLAKAREMKNIFSEQKPSKADRERKTNESGEKISQNPSQIDELPTGVELSDILELSEKELAKRIYQAETGIKYLYFVLIRKTEQMRYLAKARKLKSIYTKADREGMLADRRRKSLTNFDPSCADYRALHRILMSDEERAALYRKRRQQQAERRQQMTEDELAEERAKARQRAEAKRTQMDAAQRETARRKRAEWRRKHREETKRREANGRAERVGAE